MIPLKFELKRPQIFAEPMTYGDYLMKNTNMPPRDGVPLNTEGYIVTGTDYGDSEPTSLPFKNGDWVEKDYVNKNFVEI